MAGEILLLIRNRRVHEIDTLVIEKFEERCRCLGIVNKDSYGNCKSLDFTCEACVIRSARSVYELQLLFK